ncbi:MAG: O-succinylhomoserine sulfhydrylase [Alphaproteobacteria bacterium]
MARSNTIAKWRRQTKAVHAGTQRSQFGETSEALYLTSGYVYENAEMAEARFAGEAPGYVYSRYANPTLSMLADRLAIMEGAQAARTTASGMAAVAASLLCTLQAGDHVVACDALFGSTLYILEELCPRYGIEVSFARATDMGAWKKAMRRDTKIVFLESPTNPTLEIIDIGAVVALAKASGALVMVDNVFSTPLLQSPLELGADVVIYSTTKHIDGQGRCLGGAVLGDADFIEGPLHDYLKHTGPAMSPFNAWVMLKGLETMELRVRAHVENAQAVANYLKSRPEIKNVAYPGSSDHPQHAVASRQMAAGGPLVAIDFASGKEAAFRFLNGLDLILISNNLGDAKSLATHPATTTHSRLSPERRAILGISDGLVRFSAGIEDTQDLIDDMARGLDAIAHA